MKTANFVIKILLPFILSACVSVSLTPKTNKSKDVHFDNPGENFESIKSPGADEAWQDKKLGNSISFLSSCNDTTDPTIEGTERDMLSSLESAKILTTDQSFFDGRESRKTLAEGSVDGIPTKIEVLTFKKNNCLYMLSYVAISKSFDQDLSIFQKFLEGFKVP